MMKAKELKEIRTLSVADLEKKLQGMKASEIRKMTPEQLNEKLTSLKKDLFFLRMQHATNQLDNPVKIAAVKKDIARIKTIIREKETTV